MSRVAVDAYVGEATRGKFDRLEFGLLNSSKVVGSGSYRVGITDLKTIG
jgi:hypothetical protein